MAIAINKTISNNPIKILPKFDAKTIRAVIEKDFPNLKIEQIKLIENGWDNVVAEINGKYIFRFPKDKGANISLEMEILNFLNGKITLQIPIVEFIGKNYVYFGYRKIQGEKLSKQLIDSLEREEREKLTNDLARYFGLIRNSCKK